MSLHSPQTAPLPLTQKEREAIIDLLELCLYADAHIGLHETAIIAQTVEKIGWDKNLAFSSYEARSIAAARAAKDDEKSRLELITFAKERLTSPVAQKLAVSLCSQLFAADGTADKETQLLAQIKRVLG